MREERFTLTRTNLYEQVADHLEEMILSDDDLKEEDKLPSETALAPLRLLLKWLYSFFGPPLQ